MTLSRARGAARWGARLRLPHDQQFKEAPDDTLQLRQFGDQVESFVHLSDPKEITRLLLAEAAKSLKAESAALSLIVDGEVRTIHTYGPWKGLAWASVPLELDGRRYGLLFLGPRPSHGQYTHIEFPVLQDVSFQVARAINLAKTTNGHVSESS